MGHGTRQLSQSAGLEAPGKLFTLTSSTFETFGFAEPLARALTQVGYTTPTPIQVQALPPQLEGRDLLGLAETGSGKTATFVLPLLQEIANNPVELGWKQVHTLILAPTRELAVQIDQEVASLSRNMNIRRAVILGGVSKGPQINALKRGVHVCVATPGRLLDHVNMRSCDLSGVHTLILDEADRMFDMGFIRDINKIVSLIPMKRRTALFSATMPPEIKKFAYEILQDPFRIDLSSKQIVVDRIDQKVMIVRSAEKQSRLHTILADPACERVIVFTRTKRGADRVAERLGMAGINAAAFHGNKAQNARQRALNDFMAGHTRVLVATDIAARGIDVNNITHVINFDMPLDPETYVHRVGRTARKGTSGIAISLCDPSEKAEIKAIEKMMKQTIEVIGDVGGEHVPMPERRPHHSHDAPRREGAHRKGPSQPRSRTPRDGGRFDEQRRDVHAGRGDRDRGSRRSFDRHDEPRASRTVEAGSFNPAAELHRLDTDRPARTERPDRGDRGFRGDRPERTFDRPRDFKPRDGGFRARDGERNDRPRGEGRKPGAGEGRSFEGRSTENRGPKPEWKRDGDKPRADGPRGERPRFDGSRSDKPRHEGARAERQQGDRNHGDRASRPHSEGRGPRPEWKHDGDAPRGNGHRHEGSRHDGPRSDAPRADGPRGERPNHGKPRHGDGQHRGGGKPAGDRNWDGQKPPKFLGQRGGRKPAA